MARYKSVHTGPQIDSGVARALPGGEIDAELANKADKDYDVELVPTFGDNWGDSLEEPIIKLRLKYNTTTRVFLISGYFRHKIETEPIWYEVVASFTLPSGVRLPNAAPIIAYGTGGIVYTEFVLRENGVIRTLPTNDTIKPNRADETLCVMSMLGG